MKIRNSIKIKNSKLKILRPSSEEGFLALMSAIIISAVLMIVVFSVSFSGFMTRFNILDSEYKTKSYSLAEGYISDSFIVLAQKLSENPSYPGTGGQVSLGGLDYYEIIVSGASVTIKAHSVVERATTNIQVEGTYSGGSLVIDSWKEVPSF